MYWSNALCNQWLLVTNGDNFYAKTFFRHLDNEYDIILYDFYTRHYNANSAKYCNRLINPGSTHHSTSCMKNNGHYANTDLGANVFKLQKFIRENRKFVYYSNSRKSNSNQDGFLTSALLRDGWSSKNIEKDMQEVGCLVYHNPNYMSCVNSSNVSVWNDRYKKCYLNGKNGDRLNYYKRSDLLDRCIY